MTSLSPGALLAALSCSLLLGAAPVRAAPADGAGTARLPILQARTSCDENGRCFETGDPDDGDRYGHRRFDQDNDGPSPRRDFDQDDAPPRGRHFDDPDDRPPPRDYDRRPPPPRDFDRRGRPDDDDE